MKRLVCSLMVLFLLCPTVLGAEVSGAVALTFDGYEPNTAKTLDRLGAKGTFFLAEVQPEDARQLLENGHEIGLSLAVEQDMTPMSRRQIYGKLCAIQEPFPEKYRPVWVHPPKKWGDALNQVAKATRLSLLGWSLDARQGLTGPMIDQIRSGDVIALGQISEEKLTELIEILRSRQLEPVTVTELALEQNVDILPGKLYKKFPVQKDGEF